MTMIFCHNIYVHMINSFPVFLFSGKSQLIQIGTKIKPWLLVLEFIRVIGKLLDFFGKTIGVTNNSSEQKQLSKIQHRSFNGDFQFEWVLQKF